MNVRDLPYVIPDSMPTDRQTDGEVNDEQTTLTGRKMNAEEAGPARGAAGRPRQHDGASANFRVRIGRGNFCFESGHDYRGGCDAGSYGGGRR